ncbi:MAG: hypothetical protein JST84_04455 [Acidobacteria bacterium]|nr:hypothetical protein [Acidobacteriota bacterium]
MSRLGKKNDLEEVVTLIANSPKYRIRDICEDTIRDLLQEELKHHKRLKDAVKSARKKLHEIVAPYLGDPNYAWALQVLEESFSTRLVEETRKVCAQIMSMHASTRERLPHLGSFYSQIFELTGKPSEIIDLACGLNPLSFLWMDLPCKTSYRAYDLNHSRVKFLNQYFALQGVNGVAVWQDILVQKPQEPADVAFIFKEAYRFEKRKRGSTLALMQSLKVKYAVISLPLRNLSGKGGIGKYQRRFLDRLFKYGNWPTREMEISDELIFCVDVGQC